MQLQPKDIAGLTRALSGAFDLDELIDMMRRRLNANPQDWDLVPSDSLDRAARRVVEWCNRMGRVRELVAAMKVERPENSGTRDVIEALQIVQLGQGVDVAVRLASPGTRSSVREIQERSSRLQQYKAMHELLHRMSLPLFELIPQEAEKLGRGETTENVARQKIALHVGELDRVITSMRTVAATEAWEKENTEWIETLAGAIGKLRREIGDKSRAPNPEVLRMPDEQVPAELRQTFFAINDRIATEARGLSLNELMRVLRDTRDAISQDPRQAEDCQLLATAIDVVGRVDTDLKRHVGLHDRWQQIDRELRMLEVSRDLERDLRALRKWLDQKLDKVMEGADADWVSSFGGNRNALWAAMDEPVPPATGVQAPTPVAVAVVDGPAGVTELPAPIHNDLESVSRKTGMTKSELLRLAFIDFRASADAGFFVVDENLKRHCDRLLAIINKLDDLP